MEGINKIFCGTDVRNTGVCDCYFDPQLITGAILVPLKTIFTNEQLKDINIQATLENLAFADSKGQRIFPMGDFVGITLNSEDPTRQTFGYGSSRTVREGNYDWTLQFYKGGVNLSNALRTFNGLIGKYGVIFIESQNYLIGTSKKLANGQYGMAPIPLEDLYTRPWAPSDGTNVASYQTQYVFKPIYINQNIAFKKVDTSAYLLSELKGLEDFALEIIEVDGATLTVGAASGCGSTDLYEEYADELAVAAAWIAKDEDGANLAIASVVKNDAAGGWNVTLTSGVWEDGDTLTLVAPSVLDGTYGISGYEAGTVTVEFAESSS